MSNHPTECADVEIPGCRYAPRIGRPPNLGPVLPEPQRGLGGVSWVGEPGEAAGATSSNQSSWRISFVVTGGEQGR